MAPAKSAPKQAEKLSFEAIGTQWAIDFEVTPKDLKTITKEIKGIIIEFDKTYSRFRADSLVTKMSHQAGTYDLPSNSQPLMSLYEDMYKATSGKVTPLIGQVMVDTGYDASYSLIPGKPFTPPDWEEVILFDKQQLTLKQPALLDFGAAGKGLLVDIVSELLASKGVTEYCVDAGGDIRHYSGSSRSLRIGLENPDDPTQAIGVAEISNVSLCGSAGNRRAWANYHHIIDPALLASPQHIKAVWTVADTTVLADGMATCLFFVTPEELLRHFNFEYVVVYADSTFGISKGFPGELFITNRRSI